MGIQGFAAVATLLLIAAITAPSIASPPPPPLGGDDGMAKGPGPRVTRPIDSPEVEEALTWAVGHLSNISDSGIYKTLSISKVLSAETQEGVYHHNTFLHLELSSPHFKSRQPTETFHMVVMRSRHDGSWSFAIDQFPEMDEKAMEAFYIQKVEAHRAKREDLFRQMRAASSAPPAEICSSQGVCTTP